MDVISYETRTAVMNVAAGPKQRAACSAPELSPLVERLPHAYSVPGTVN
jgi:hypothetical protein